MSHEVETMMYAGEKPWHGLGTKIDGQTTFWDAFKQAGLDWEVEVEPIFDHHGIKIEKHNAVVRQSDRRTLGVVGDRWTPLQNRDAFQTFEPLVDSGELTIDTAGSLRNGERIWALGKLNKSNSVIVPGDEIAKYVLLSNGHDGKLAVHMGFTPIRVVCANTEAMARNTKASRLVRVRHHRFVKQSVDALRDIMNLANAEFEATADQYRALAAKDINAKDLKTYVKIVLGLEEIKNDDLTTRSANIVADIEKLFVTGKGNDIVGTRGTYWAAYNAVTEYLNYNKGRSNETRVDSLWYGQNAVMNQKALDTAMALAA